VALQRNYVWLLVVGLIVALAIVALPLSATLAGGMSHPLDLLSAALARVAAEDLSVRVKPSGPRELRVLGASFNAMAERLEAARDAVRRAEREAAWRQVARFLAHEIGNMVQPLGSHLNNLREDVGSLAEPERAAARGRIESAENLLEDLRRLANNFSQYARLPEPRLERLDFALLVRELAAQRGARCVGPGDGTGALAVKADRMLLSRALDNLILNAREADPQRAPEIRMSGEGPSAVVEILDLGPGISDEVRDRLFEPFVSTKKRGSGLGLALVRDIVIQHRGTVILENRPEGGARATLTLPRIEPRETDAT
jgi:nitrogen fixation/metabolism regulation signal transduction histidine kinase